MRTNKLGTSHSLAFPAVANAGFVEGGGYDNIARKAREKTPKNTPIFD